MNKNFLKEKSFSYFIRRIKDQFVLLRTFFKDPFFKKNNKNRALFLTTSPTLIRKLLWNKFYKSINEKSFKKEEANCNFDILSDLAKNGICHVGKLSESLLKEINSNYPLDLKKNLIGELNFDSTLLQSIHQEVPELSRVARSYYGRNCFYRNKPSVHVSTKSISDKYKVQSISFHTDHFRQLSVMILLNSIDMNHYHMEYVLGTHKDFFLFILI